MKNILCSSCALTFVAIVLSLAAPSSANAQMSCSGHVGMCKGIYSADVCAKTAAACKRGCDKKTQKGSFVGIVTGTRWEVNGCD